MKQRLYIIAVVLVFLTTVACGQDSSRSLGIGQEDLYLNVGSARYGLNINIENVIADFGEDYEYAEAMSCDYDGLDKTFIYDMAEFYTFPLQDGDTVSEIYSDSPEASTSRGIRVGAAKGDVLAVYGQPTEDTDYQLIYAIEGGSLCFDLHDGVVKGFYITVRPF